MNQFAEKYSTLSNYELLIILKNRQDYKPEAIQQAEKEIQSRQLSENEIQLINNQFDQEKQTRKVKKERQQIIQNKIKNKSFTFFDTINPIQESAPTIEKYHRLTIIVFSIFAVYKIYISFPFILYLLLEDNVRWEPTIIDYLIPITILPTALFFFYKKQKVGWYLFSSFIVYNIISLISILFLTWQYESSFSFLDSLFPRIPKINQLIVIGIYSSILWLLCKKDMVNFFDISQRSLKKVLIISGFISVLIAKQYW